MTLEKIEAAAISNCKSPQMLPPFPEVIAPTVLGFALSAIVLNTLRLMAKTDKKECERRMGFWRAPTALAEKAPIEICVV